MTGNLQFENTEQMLEPIFKSIPQKTIINYVNHAIKAIEKENL